MIHLPRPAAYKDSSLHQHALHLLFNGRQQVGSRDPFTLREDKEESGKERKHANDMEEERKHIYRKRHKERKPGPKINVLGYGPTFLLSQDISS